MQYKDKLKNRKIITETEKYSGGKMDLVSVVVPAYNAETYLGRCIESIICQTYPKLEIIIIDDGSEDETLSLAEQYADKDSRIQVYSQKNQGVSRTRNRGIELSEGEYLLFIESDDYIESNMIEYLRREYGDSEPDIVICGYRTDENADITREEKVIGKVPEVRQMERNQAWEKLFYRDSFQGFSWNKLWKSKIIKTYGIRFAEDITICEDLLFCCEYFHYISKAVYVSAPLYIYEIKEDSATDSNCLNLKRYSELDAYRRMERLLQTEGQKKVLRAMYNHLATDCMLLTKMTLKYRKKYMKNILSYVRRTGWYYLKSEWQIKFKLAYVPLKIISYFYGKKGME